MADFNNAYTYISEAIHSISQEIATLNIQYIIPFLCSIIAMELRLGTRNITVY